MAQRYAVAFPVRLLVNRDGCTQCIEAQTADASSAGLRVACRGDAGIASLTPGMEVVVGIQHSGAEYHCGSRVAHVSHDAVGLQLLDVDAAFHEKWRDIIVDAVLAGTASVAGVARVAGNIALLARPLPTGAIYGERVVGRTLPPDLCVLVTSSLGEDGAGITIYGEALTPGMEIELAMSEGAIHYARGRLVWLNGEFGGIKILEASEGFAEAWNHLILCSCRKVLRRGVKRHAVE